MKCVSSAVSVDSGKFNLRNDSDEREIIIVQVKKVIIDLIPSWIIKREFLQVSASTI